MLRSTGGDWFLFAIVAGVLQGDTLAPYLFIICLDYVLPTTIYFIKENGLIHKKAGSRWYPAETTTDSNYAVDVVFLVNLLKQNLNWIA